MCAYIYIFTHTYMAAYAYAQSCCIRTYLYILMFMLSVDDACLLFGWRA